MKIRLTQDYQDIKAGDYDRLDPRLSGLVSYLLRTGLAEILKDAPLVTKQVSVEEVIALADADKPVSKKKAGAK